LLTNTAPFIALGIITILQLAVVLKKSDNRLKLLALYIVFFGFTLLIETTLLIYLKAYEYYPKVFPDDQFMDSLFGNLFSQASVACTGLLIAFFDLNIFWVLAIIAAYFGIEHAFLALGVYGHHWFRSWMTSAGMLPLFWINKKLFQKYYGVYGKVFEFLCGLTGFFALDVVLFNWSCFIATGVMGYNRGILPDANMSWPTLAIVHGLFLFLICRWAYKAKRWVWKTVCLMICIAVYYAGYRFGAFYLKPGWFVPYTAITIAAAYFFVAFLGRYIKSNAPHMAVR
jgi:hypothetical protein